MKKEIYFAGGCFWGVQEYYSRLKGVIATTSGYANGEKENPTYQEVRSGIYKHAETVRIVYDDEILSLEKLLEHYLRFVDPYSLNKQGEDEGIQYRSGIYYNEEEEKERIIAYFDSRLDKGYAIEVLPLKNFYDAEEYHQDYLKKNVNGYCHVNLNLIKKDEKK
ncbi:MAG: peptide-methionine (S)-S-oxide reductase MsrA [Bacilli bacterium]|nr:peptide-methionine (S)-S-oxide reductase MsrA [Bacilli bacterium]